MAQSNIKILTPDEIKQLNRESFDLNEKKFYAIVFLINDQLNDAEDPAPFRVATSFVEILTKTGMGRPWIPDTLSNGKHVRPVPGSTTDELLEFQKKYAGGVMRGYHVNPITHNASVVIEIYPEYIDSVKNGLIPRYVSPMIGTPIYDDNNEVIGGEILHISSVDSAGYDPRIAKFLGTCEGGFNECAIQLEPLAAAGKLKEYRNSSMSCPKKFLNTIAANGNHMSDVSNAVVEKTPTTENKDTSDGEAKIIEKLDGIQSKVDDIEKSQETVKEAVLDVAIGAAGVDEEKIKEKLGMGAAGDNKDDDDKTKHEVPIAAAGNQAVLDELKLVKKQNADLKKVNEDAAKLQLQKERIRQVDMIIKSKLLSKEIKLEDKEKQTKQWLERKSTTNPEVLADLSILAEEAEKRINSIIPSEENPALAAYGIHDGYAIPDSTEINYAKIEEMFS